MSPEEDREAIKAKTGEARDGGTNADLLPWPSGALESITDA
jgi:hypothetical protein